MSLTILQNSSASEQTFFQFLFQNQRNRFILYLSAVAIIIQFAIFKYLYPFANYIHGDSFAYLIAADQNQTIDIYPIGYSKFLRLISVFAKPDLILVSLQYLVIQSSLLFLLFTIFYFYKTGKIIQSMLFFSMTFNPLLLHLGNMVSSDGIFLALSMTWFALLLWIVFAPSNKIIYWHAIVLFIAFTVRYNALIYPFIAVVALGLSKLSLRKKLTGLGLGVLLIGWFMGLSMFQYKKLTGYWQFSPFSGWLLANNAMYAYREVDSADRKPVPLKFHELDSMVRNFHKMNPNWQKGEIGSAYMWKPEFPFEQYTYSLFKDDTGTTVLKAWASMGPFYHSYGMYIIKNYPLQFLRYFVLPNTQNYFAPPVEFLGYYNSGISTVKEPAVRWFGYTNNHVKTRIKYGKVWVLQYYPFIVSIINLMMILLLLVYILLKGWQYNKTFNKIFLLAVIACIVNAGFIIFTCSAALRFEAFPVFISAIFSLLLIDWLGRLMQYMKHQNQQEQQDEFLTPAQQP